MRVAALLELGSVSRVHVWIPGLLEAPSGLWMLLELWLDMPLGLGGLLGPSEASAADPVGEENCSSLRLVVRKLVKSLCDLTMACELPLCRKDD